MDRFDYCNFKLEENETFLKTEKGVKLYDGDLKTSFQGGELVLTNYRLLWGEPGDISKCLKCLSLSLSYIVFVEEQQSETFFSKSKKLIIHLAEPETGKGLSPLYNSNTFIKLSFKDDLDSHFLISLNEAIAARAWQRMRSSPQASTSQNAQGIKLRTGIVGIERGIQEKQKTTDENISAAFKDLNKLMSMANDMVKISKAISSKIREKQGDITEDETVRFKSYLLSLGINDPVTRNSFNNDNQYYQSLARQLAEIMEQPIIEVGGIMSLTDVYCRVNRARGLELLSPEDLLAACQLLDHLKLPLRLREFESGVKVLQLQSHSDEVIVADTTATVKENGSFSAEQLAQSLGISVVLAKERLLTTEQQGCICRDESIEGLRFYPNLFLHE
ncbi:vacuolar protein-sorting-associated protein 36 isoform X2 [Nilaparvata lugens]|uniref:vacuolar protein-sorting-associated protein 36 isoform X1 n=1 Tax=Nilaparvata lugens TaxID=108931 RepID=UPI00193D2EE3|nr:vacuolar protein-sorting-associated protein 36 isoform X1 [Nilaparvata lugens]XP_039279875.1 vacuolar protein-sorting-associated protein 36 isoform X2 [Nilaparvata lugens]